MNRELSFRAWIRKDKKMMSVKLIGGGYLWTDDTWLDNEKTAGRNGGEGIAGLRGS